MHHSGYIFYDRYGYVKSRYIQTKTLRGHACMESAGTHTHDTRYMQNYSKLGLEQPGAAAALALRTMKRAPRALHKQGCRVAGLPASASEFQDTCRNSYMMNS